MTTSTHQAGDEESFLTVEETGRILKVSKSTVRRLARGGRLPGAFKVGDQWRVRTEALGTGAASTPQRNGGDPYGS
jgi:excisionase family DNA binding protein